MEVVRGEPQLAVLVQLLLGVNLHLALKPASGISLVIVLCLGNVDVCLSEAVEVAIPDDTNHYFISLIRYGTFT